MDTWSLRYCWQESFSWSESIFVSVKGGLLVKPGIGFFLSNKRSTHSPIERTLNPTDTKLNLSISRREFGSFYRRLKEVFRYTINRWNRKNSDSCFMSLFLSTGTWRKRTRSKLFGELIDLQDWMIADLRNWLAKEISITWILSWPW